MVKIINGKEIADQILKDITQNILPMEENPGLSIILVGDDPASNLYVNLKKKAGEKCGILINRYLFPENCQEKEILETIEFLNNDPQTNGIIIQLPLPPKFDTDKIIKTINPQKDVDGFHPENLELIKKNRPRILSPLALGILTLIQSTGEKLTGKSAVIIGNNEILTIPLRYLLEKEEIKVNCLLATDKNLKKLSSMADILIVAVGKENFIKASMVKKNAIVIDVGINHSKNGTIVGDVSIDAGIKAGFITPVPGGVGPMTVAMLLYNTLFLKNNQKS